MKQFIALTLLALPLCSCADMMLGARKTAINVRDDYHETKARVKTYFELPAYEKPQKKAVAERYCYRVMQDIACYAQPVPGAETRLVAYQGSVMDVQQVASSSGSVKVDTAVLPVRITEGPQSTAPETPMIIGDARDRAFDKRAPGDLKPIFIAPMPEVAAASSTPQEPAH